VLRDDSRKLLGGNLLCRSHGHRFQCCAGCHHSGRRPHRLQVYSPSGNSRSSNSQRRCRVSLSKAPHPARASPQEAPSRTAVLRRTRAESVATSITTKFSMVIPFPVCNLQIIVFSPVISLHSVDIFCRQTSLSCVFLTACPLGSPVRRIYSAWQLTC
jgi:hypothetical protein